MESSLNPSSVLGDSVSEGDPDLFIEPLEPITSKTFERKSEILMRIEEDENKRIRSSQVINSFLNKSNIEMSRKHSN
jgi:hypothetical protein